MGNKRIKKKTRIKKLAKFILLFRDGSNPWIDTPLVSSVYLPRPLLPKDRIVANHRCERETREILPHYKEDCAGMDSLPRHSEPQPVLSL